LPIFGLRDALVQRHALEHARDVRPRETVMTIEAVVLPLMPIPKALAA
jgi:hypothetical protein